VLPAGRHRPPPQARAGHGRVTYRGWFLLASAGLLALGVVQLTRAQRQCSTRKRGSLAILALSTVIVVLVALFPQVLAALIAEWLP
jgi:uncharacterized membrane protein